MVKRLLNFLGNYKLLCWVVAGIILGIILQLLRHTTLANWIISIFSVIAIIAMLSGMWHLVRAGKYSIDLPGVIAVVASIVLHQYWVGPIVVVILIVNDRLTTIIIDREHKKQRKLLEQIPKIVHVFRKHKLVDIQLEDVRVGEEIEIRPGEVVPLDGLILKGSSDFSELSVTGQSKSERHEVGETILSGATNLSETVTAKVLQTAYESQIRQLIRFERTAVNSTAPFSIQADRYGVIFMLVVYIIAVVAWLLSGQPLRFLEVILIVSPAPFILAPLLALTNGLSLAFKNGIVIKTNIIFERLANAKTIGFDKANTLDRKAAEIDEITAFKPYTRLEIEVYAASMLQRSNHSLAQVIRNIVLRDKLKLQKAKHIKELTGFGAEARIGSKEVIIGNYGLIKERGITTPENFQTNKLDQTAMFIGVNGSLIGYITFKDSYRPDIKPMLKSLAKFGISRTLMVTDESRLVGLKIAKQLGITDVKAEVQLGDRLLAIEAVEDRPLIFIGNGVHDASVLTTADVGIAIGARGSIVAAEPADIIILKDDLNYVALAMAIAKKSFKLARQAMLLAAGIGLILALAALTGKVHPLEGIIIRVGIEAITIGFIWLRSASNVPH